MDFTFTTQLHYLVHQVDGDYVAHCLDLDLVGSGDTVDEAVKELNSLVKTVVLFCVKSGRSNISSHCSRAPQDYWDKFRVALDQNGSTIGNLEVSPDLAPVNVMQCHFTYCMAVAA